MTGAADKPHETAETDAQVSALSSDVSPALQTLVSLAGWTPSSSFVERVPIAYARRHGVMGFAGDGGDLLVVARDLSCAQVVDIVGRWLDKVPLMILASDSIIQTAINTAYEQQTGQAERMVASLSRDQVLADVRRLAGREDLLDGNSREPVVKLVNLLLFEAVQARASDLHVQPYEDRVVVRQRIDGVLYDSLQLPVSVRDEVISRIKVMGRMNVAERRLPQDGRCSVEVGDRSIDLRIATLPTSFGERAVIRLLDKSLRLYTLEELGMPADTLRQFRRLITAEHGIILVTGPTGSGKTTTLYAALRELNAAEKNVLTLEDPIEYQLDGISQTQVNEKKGMTFVSGLRSVLRQDPDVIMVGEIRDRDTATMAIQSALTGHLVFSTLHTNDATSAIVRLMDLGIEPYLIASSVIGVLAQRLVRRVCPACARADKLSADQMKRLGLTCASTAIRRGGGCGECRETGYRGRMGVFELLRIDGELRNLVHAAAGNDRLKSVAIAAGMKTLRDDGLNKMAAGLTTVDEVLRVTLNDG